MRYSQSFHLDFAKGSAKMLGTELRAGIIDALLRLGHEVIVMSVIARDHLHVLQGVGKGFDYSAFKSLTYRPGTVPKIDLLIIEGSTTNVMYGGEAILRTRDILKKYDGPVAFYHHSDASMGMPLGAIIDGEGSNFKGISKLHHMNYKRIFKGVGLKGKWTLLTHADTDLLTATMDNNRHRYSAFDNAVRIPLGYSHTFDRVKKIISFRERKHRLVYIGKQKTDYRSERMFHLYGEKDVGLFGNWKAYPRHWKYYGFVPGHGNLYLQRLYQFGKASIVTGDKFFLEHGMMTTRFVESIRSGTIVFVDEQFKDADMYVAPRMIISNPEDTEMIDHADESVLRWLLNEQWRSLKEWQDIFNDALPLLV